MSETLELLAPGVRVAPFVALCRRPILLAIGVGGVLLASVVVFDDGDEARLRAELERLVQLYDRPPRIAQCGRAESQA